MTFFINYYRLFNLYLYFTINVHQLLLSIFAKLVLDTFGHSEVNILGVQWHTFSGFCETRADNQQILILYWYETKREWK